MEGIAAELGLELGSIPMWGAFLGIMGILLKMVLPWRQLTFDSEKQIRAELKQRVDELKNECKGCHEEIAQVKEENLEAIKACRDECDEETRKLQEQIFGMRKQAIREQLSFINAIIESVGPESPALRILLRTMENGQRALEKAHMLTGVVGDAKGADGK